MPYCIKCGFELESNAHFCTNCGSSVEDYANSSNQEPKSTKEYFNNHVEKASTTNFVTNEGQRKTLYEGITHKCPSCGEILTSFTGKCPLCGHEIRDAESSYHVKDFSLRLENAVSIEEQIQLVKTYVVPNTKEDILEFIVLAKSNISLPIYSYSGHINEIKLSDAWLSKYEQCFEKAKLLNVDDLPISKIEEEYNETVKAVQIAKIKGKRKIKNKRLFPIVAISVAILLVIAIICITVFQIEKHNTTELQNRVNAVETLIGEKDYDAAMAEAEKIVYSGNNSNIATRWANAYSNEIQKIEDLMLKDLEDVVNGFIDIKDYENARLSVQEIEYSGSNYESKLKWIERKQELSEKIYELESIDLGKIKVGYSSSSLHLINKDEAKKKLQDSGFINIEFKKEEDIIFGILYSDGDVGSIIIDGETSFKENSYFYPDAKVIIEYHTIPDEEE